MGRTINYVNAVRHDAINSVNGQTPNLDLSESESPIPSVSVSGGLFGIVDATITRAGGGTYTNPNYGAECTLADGTVTVTDANIDRVLESDSSHLSNVLKITDSNVSAAQRTVTVTMQEFGDLTRSQTGSATYTPSGVQAEYIRIWSCDASGNTVAGNSFAVLDWRVYTGGGQSGTSLPPNLTAADSATDIVISAGHTYAPSGTAYVPYKAFDSNTTSTWWWSIGNQNVANQWLQIQFEEGTYDTKPVIKSMSIIFRSSFVPDYFKLTSSANADHSSATTHAIFTTNGVHSTALNFG